MHAETFFSDRSSRAYGGSRADRDIILIVYVLYLLGFFTGITAIGGALLAHYRRARTRDPQARAHYIWQIRLFWLGVLAWIAIGVAHGAVAALGALTGGIGLVFMIVPWGMIAAWSVLTLWAILRGTLALYRARPIAAYRPGRPF